jgi:hypothetical protein
VPSQQPDGQLQKQHNMIIIIIIIIIIIKAQHCVSCYLNTRLLQVALISGFLRDVDVTCGLLGNYTASCCNYLPTFRDNVSVPSSWVKIPRWKGKGFPSWNLSVVIIYRRFGTTCRSHLHGSIFQDGKERAFHLGIFVW